MPRPRTKASRIIHKVYYPRKNKNKAIVILKLLAKKSPSVLSIKQIAEKLGSDRNAYPHKRAKSILEELSKLDYCTEHAKISNPDTRCKNCGSGKYLVEKTKLDNVVKLQEMNTKEIPKYEDEPSFDSSIWLICEHGYVLEKSISDKKCFECGKPVGVDTLETKYKIHDNERYWALSDNGMMVMLTLLSKGELLKFYSKNSTNKIIECVNALYDIYQKDWVDVLITDLNAHVANTPNLLKIAETWLEDQHYRHDIFKNYCTYDSRPTSVV